MMLEQFNLSEEDKIKLKKSGLVILGLIIVAIIILLYTSTFKKDLIRPIKETKSKSLVYTKKERTYKGIKSVIPYLNIKGSKMAAINEDIESFTDKYYSDSRNIISYTYDVSDKILSLVVKVAYFDKVYFPIFRTYNINLSDLTVLTDADLLDKFDLTEDDVEAKIADRFKYFYNDAVSKNYYGGECDYNCFLYFRGDKPYLDGIHYYMKDSKLYVYKEFNIYSVYDEENYFKESDFLIQVSEL